MYELHFYMSVLAIMLSYNGLSSHRHHGSIEKEKKRKKERRKKKRITGGPIAKRGVPLSCTQVP